MGHEIDHDVQVAYDGRRGLTLKAATPQGRPVELNSGQARRLAARLAELAERDDADWMGSQRVSGA